MPPRSSSPCRLLFAAAALGRRLRSPVAMAYVARVAALATALAVVAAVAATPRAAVAAAAAASPGDAATITDWWVVNATSGSRLQPLQQYKPVINATVPSLRTIVVEPSTEAALPAVATIAAACARAVRLPPYVLAGGTDGKVLTPQRQLPSPYSLVAYVRLAGAASGQADPIPTAAAAWEPAPADDDLPIPTLAPGCEGPPTINSTTSQGTIPWSDRKWVYDVHARNCRGEANRFRLQMFTAPADRSGPPIRAFQSIEATAPGDGNAEYPRYDPDRASPNLNRSCLPRAVFLDMCVRPAAAAPAVCVRSPVRTMEALPKEQVVLGEPRLPPTLTVERGVSLTLTANVTVPGGCRRDASAGPRRCPHLVGVVRRTNGSVRRGGTVSGSILTINALAGGVALADDGALVYVEYTRAECGGLANAIVGSTYSQSGHPVTATTVRVVVAGSAAVTRQDTAVPVIHRVEYPRTRWGEPVAVRVQASVAGRRGEWRAANGSIVPTALTYQWYLADRDSSYAVDEPTPIAGQTGPVLALDKAVCNNFLTCGRYGCTYLVRYVAEVCSTAGCTRSPMVLPVVAPPADAALAARLLRTGECPQFA